MRSVRDITVLHNVPVLVRASLNVEVVDGKVINDFRLRRAVPTIDYLRKKGARVILIGHVSDTDTDTLKPIAAALSHYVPNVVFSETTVGARARDAVRALPAGGVLMLENLRRYRGEKMNDRAFAAELAELADVFVQDSFDVCHRPHASVVGVPELLPSYAGFQIEEEVRELRRALKPKSPSLAIIGGAKFVTKEPVLKKLLHSYDRVFVGGALGNDFIQAMGHPVGKSLVSHADKVSVKALLSNRRLALPLDAVVAAHGAKREAGRIVNFRDMTQDEAIYDNGPETIAFLKNSIDKSKTVLWNGPLGNYENGFTEGTEALARVIAASGTYSIVGGGDTVACVEKLGIAHRFSFISTGGGAMLDFIAKGTLPGLSALG